MLLSICPLIIIVTTWNEKAIENDLKSIYVEKKISYQITAPKFTFLQLKY